MDDLVKKYGSQAKAYNAVQDAANKAFKEGKLKPSPENILPKGDAGYSIKVGGLDVRLIGGYV